MQGACTRALRAVDRVGIEEPGKPLAPFGQVTANAPEHVQIGCKSQSVYRIRLNRPCERGPQVVVLTRGPGERRLLLRALPCLEELLGQRDEMGQMTASPSRFLAAVAQAIQRVLAYRLQHSIPCRARLLVGQD